MDDRIEHGRCFCGAITAQATGSLSGFDRTMTMIAAERLAVRSRSGLDTGCTR